MAYTTIDKPDEYFNTITWTGNGSSPRTITGVGFNPDFIWGKRRDDAAGHNLYDRVRGAGVSTNLQSNSTGAEGGGSPGTFGYLSSFETDGFGVTDGSTDNAYWNNNTATYVAWNWLANGAGVSNTAGSITSTVSANTTSGFSIVSYTGTGANATVGHGLGSAPKMVIFKNRDNGTQEWDTYHVGLTNATYFIQLNSSNAQSNTNGALRFNSTAPSTNYFSVGTATTTNESGSAMIAYCFAEKKGFSKFGSYTGNGNADGTFVYTGFKPAFVIVKISSGTTNNWTIMDNKINTYNTVTTYLIADTSGAQGTDMVLDFLSNGFKPRATFNSVNGSGYTYIYMAFAENPFVTSSGVPATAR